MQCNTIQKYTNTKQYKPSSLKNPSDSELLMIFGHEAVNTSTAGGGRYNVLIVQIRMTQMQWEALRIFSGLYPFPGRNHAAFQIIFT